MRTPRLIDAEAIGRLLPMAECIAALDAALASSVREPVESFVGGARAREGKFHIKAALGTGADPLFVAKINANYPRNPEHGRPTIQGVLVLFDATTGEPLATMDSAAITVIRTAAATAVAARHLAPAGATSLAIVGCGAQALHHARAINVVRPLRRITLFDTDRARVRDVQRLIASDVGVASEACDDLAQCTRDAGMIVTLTSSRQPFLGPNHVEAGTFIGAVGTDSPDKSEIQPALMRSALVVVDDRAQCAEMGDLRLAIERGVMTAADAWVSLAEVCAEPDRWRPPLGRTVVFDSTGIPIEDLVAARIVFQRASTEALSAESCH